MPLLSMATSGGACTVKLLFPFHQMQWVSGGPDMQGYSSLQPGQTV